MGMLVVVLVVVVVVVAAAAAAAVVVVVVVGVGLGDTHESSSANAWYRTTAVSEGVTHAQATNPGTATAAWCVHTA